MSPEESLERLVGQIFDSRYRICDQLGAGAMGTVFRAEHVEIGRKVAVKILNPQMRDNEKFRLRFEREAALAGLMHHPNVVGAIDVGTTPEGLRYLVMEYAEGRTLAELLEDGAMAQPRVMSLVRQLCDGLHHAHEHGLVHRDLKPDNVIIEQHGDGEETPRILDFGIGITITASPSGERKRLTTDGVVLGTPYYMAPEHASGQEIDHRADLFSLGVICYEMLTGTRPFEGSGAEVVRAYQAFPIPSMKQRVPHIDVDPLLEAFTRALLARSRDERLPSARAARALLDLIARDPAAAAQQLGVGLGERRRMRSVSLAPLARFPCGTERSPAIEPLPAEEVPAARKARVVTGADAQATVRARVPGRAATSDPIAEGAEGDRPAGAPASADDVPAVGPVDPMAPRSCVDLAGWGSEPEPGCSASLELLGLGGLTPAHEPRASRGPEVATCAMSLPRKARSRWRAARRLAVLAAAGLFVIGALALGGGQAPASLAIAPSSAELLSSPLPALAPLPPSGAVAPATQVAVAAPAAPSAAPAAPSAAPAAAVPAVPAAVPTRHAPQSSHAPATAAPAAPARTKAPQAAPSTAAVAARYGEVGRALKRLDDTHGQVATHDLWPRFRRIQILASLHTPGGCAQTDDELRYIERQIAQRSR